MKEKEGKKEKEKYGKEQEWWEKEGQEKIIKNRKVRKEEEDEK